MRDKLSSTYYKIKNNKIINSSTNYTVKIIKHTTGDQPDPLWWTASPSTPIILGTEGPQMSISIMATFEENFYHYMNIKSIFLTINHQYGTIITFVLGFLANTLAIIVVIVLFPTPPLPERTMICIILKIVINHKSTIKKQ